MASLGLRRATVTLIGVFAALAATSCDRNKMLAAVDDYLQGLATGTAAPVHSGTSKFTNYENNKTVDITTGIMTRGFTVDHNRTIVDLLDCATYTEVVATVSQDHFTKYVIGVQMRYSLDDNTIYEMDSVVTTNGSWAFNGTSTLQRVKAENWNVLPQAKRSSRAELRRVADAYLDMWTNKSAIAAIPWGDGCKRVEGGNYYSCPAGIPTNNSQLPNSHRRYVIDETVGSVDVISVWEHLNDTIDSHEFRLESGKLHFVHAMSWTDNRKCAEEREGWRCR